VERERACRAVYYYSIASTRLFSQLRIPRFSQDPTRLLRDQTRWIFDVIFFPLPSWGCPLFETLTAGSAVTEKSDDV